MDLTLKTRNTTEPALEELLSELNKEIPFSQDAELGVLSGILQDVRGRLLHAVALLPSDAFYTAPCRIVWDALIDMNDKAVPIDVTTITHTLRDRQLLEKVGGPGAISDLFSFIPIQAHYDFYLKVIRDKWRIRKAMHGYALSLWKMFNHGREHIDEGADTILASCLEAVTEATGDIQNRARSATVIECVAEHVDYMGSISCGERKLIRTGIPTFDLKAGGIADDEYVLVTGPTKGGKTVLGQHLFKQVCLDGGRADYFSAEVSRRTLAGRMIYNMGYASARIDRTGFTNTLEQESYAKAVRELQMTVGKSGRIVEAQGLPFEELLQEVRARAKMGSKMFIIDYLAKFYSNRQFASREKEMSYMSARLFDEGKQLQVAMIVLAQLNDNGEVKDCRNLEMDCDMHLSMKRVFTKDKVTKEDVEDVNRRFLFIECARNVESGYAIPLHFDGKHFQLREIDERNRNNP